MTPDGGVEAINSPINHKNVFSTWYRTDVKAKLMVEYMAKNGIKKLALMYQNDPYYNDLAKRIEKYAALNNITIVDAEKINEGTADVRTPALKIRDSQPDAVFFGLYDEKDIYNLLKIHKDTFLGVTLYGDEFVHDHYGRPEYKDLYEDAVYFHAAAPASDFVAKYKARFGSEPVFGAGPAYDATMILARMLEEKGLNASDYDTYLLTTTFDSVSYGSMTFDDIRGVKTANNQYDLWKIQNNKAVKVN